MQLTSLVDLLDVQEIDLQIDRLLHQRESLGELEGYREAHNTLEASTAELDRAAAHLRELELDFDKSEGELELLEAKLAEHETRLFAGGMSARETEYMRLEVESLRGQREAKEERVLVMLDDVDPAREAVRLLESSIEKVSAEKTRLEGVIKAEWEKIDAELARRHERKREALEPIPADLIEMYERLRKAKEGVAVGRLEHGVCGGCHMTLSPAEQAEALAEQVPRCAHCRRILIA
jgi:uncharacterized protein